MRRNSNDKAARTTMRGRLLRIVVAISATAALVVGLGVFTSVGTATSSAVPTNSTPPAISGTPVVGSTLTTDNGAWAGTAPITYSYQWLRCDANGGSCAAIIGETANTYAVKNVDVGTRLRAVVTSTNAEGSNASTSVPTEVVQPAAAANPPKNTAAPTISGAPKDGSTLVANRGTWTGSEPITYSYRWLRCDKAGGSCSFIGGSTSQTTHVLVPADVGNTLRVEVTGSNAAGAASVRSAPTAVVQAKTPAAPAGCAKKGGSIAVSNVSPPARLTIDQMQVSPSLISYGTRFITARFHVAACSGSVQGALVYATAAPYAQFTIPNEQETDANGWATLQFTALPGFPAARRQQLLVMFVRARKAGENLLGGISTRRLVSFRVVR